jgi:hypothetical protein
VWAQDNGGMKRIIFSAAIVISSYGLLATQAPATFATTTRLGTVTSTHVGLDQKTVTLTPPSSNSPGKWVITIEDPTIASVTGLTLTLLRAGSTQITYTQLASGVFTSNSRQAVLVVDPGTPILGSWAPVTAALTAGSYTITPPTSSSTGTWNYSISNALVAGHQIATISGSKITLLDAGTLTINATQYATSSWKSITATTTLAITAIAPVVGTFTNITIAKDSVSSLSLTPPTSTSSGAWSFTSSDSSIAIASGTTLTPVAVGTATITAYQAPAGGYSSARATMVLTVTAAAPVVGGFTPITYTLGSSAGNQLALTAPESNSPGAWSYSVADPTIATVSASTLTILKAGNTTITATQQASGNYGVSLPQTFALSVNAVATYSALPNLSQVAGDPARTITPPTSLSTGAWTMSSSDPTIAAVNGLTLSFGNAGKATVTLSQAAAGSYLAGTTTFTVSVAGLVPTIGTLAPVTIEVGAKLATIPNPTSNSAGGWSYATADPSIATVVEGKIVGIKVGTTMIYATQSPSGKYGQSNTAQAVLTVTAASKPAPTPTKTPTPTPAPTPTKTPTATKSPTLKPAVVPLVTVKSSGKKIIITAKGGKVIATINGAPAKVGSNTARAGDNLVIVEFDNQVIYSRVITIK